MKLFYLEVRHSYTRQDGGTGETWQCFTSSPIITELLSLVWDKPLMSRSSYRITNNKQLPTITF